MLGEAHTMNSDEFERIQGMRRAVYDSEDYQEGMNAFLKNVNPISWGTEGEDRAMKVSWSTMSADDAAEIIQHNDMVAFSGFTPAGSPKALPAAIARRANALHQMRQPFQIRLLTGASISAAADDALSEADAVSWRAPYQTSTGLRQKINQGQVKFVDLHLSEVAQMVNYGFFGDIDVAVIEATAITSDGRVWLSSGIGNAPTWLLRAQKVIIELNHYHSPRVAELADIVIPGAAAAQQRRYFSCAGSGRSSVRTDRSAQNCRSGRNESSRCRQRAGQRQPHLPADCR